MTRSKFLKGTVLSLACFAGGMLVAQGGRHPNLRAAQDLINQAYDRITAAQGANEFDMGGHAAKAKDLLLDAKREIRLAAENAKRHEDRPPGLTRRIDFRSRSSTSICLASPVLRSIRGGRESLAHLSPAQTLCTSAP